MFDQLRDLLNDTSDTQVPFATKKLYLNRGIARLWPRVWQAASTTITLVNEQYDYTMPAAVYDGAILSVEITTEENGTEFVRWDEYDVLPGDFDTAGVFRITARHPGADFDIRITYAKPPGLIAAASYVAAQAETWTGPDRAIGLPVLYALGMVTARKLDDRQDTLRYSTTQATNGVTDQDLMGASQMWFAQFEAELEQLHHMMPPARD